MAHVVAANTRRGEGHNALDTSTPGQGSNLSRTVSFALLAVGCDLYGMMCFVLGGMNNGQTPTQEILERESMSCFQKV